MRIHSILPLFELNLETPGQKKPATIVAGFTTCSLTPHGDHIGLSQIIASTWNLLRAGFMPEKKKCSRGTAWWPFP
jgi:hypothetical protein